MNVKCFCNLNAFKINNGSLGSCTDWILHMTMKTHITKILSNTVLISISQNKHMLYGRNFQFSKLKSKTVFLFFLKLKAAGPVSAK